MSPDLINLGLSGRCSSAIGKISNFWVPHDLAYLDVALSSRRPTSGVVALQFRIGTALSWYTDTRIEGAKLLFAALTLTFTFIKAYTIMYVASEGGILAFTGPVLAQLILMVALSSAATWLAVYVQFAAVLGVMIGVLVYRSRIVITQTVDGKKVVYMATAAQMSQAKLLDWIESIPI